MKIYSMYGGRTEIFERLNAQMGEYARENGMEFGWVTDHQTEQWKMAETLALADAILIDAFPIGETVFSAVSHRKKLVITFGAGYDHIDLESAKRHGIAVARTPGENSAGVAEMALSMILACRRLHHQNDSLVRCGGDWFSQKAVPETIGCATVGLVGFGNIARRLAVMLRSLGCDVVVWARRRDEELAGTMGFRYLALDELFRCSDAVSIHVAYNPGTHHLISRNLLESMKPSAVLVNTARGKVVDEEALAGILAEGRIAGAALDVFGEEPLPLSSPFTKLDNVLLSPHAGTNTEESVSRVFRAAVDISAAWFEGRPDDRLLCR